MTLTTFNPADKAAGITLSNGNNTATGSSGNNSVRGTTSHASGKFYLEYNTITQVGGSGIIGLENSTISLTTNSTNNVGVSPSGSFPGGTFSASPAGHVVGVAVDFTNLKVWFRYDAGNWNNSGTADPTTNVGGASISLLSGGSTLFPFVFLQNGGAVTLNVDSTAFAHAAPSGFSPWDGVPGASGGWTSTETADTFAAIGHPGAAGIVGDLLVTEASDAFTAAGFARLNGAWASVEAPDVFSAFGRQPLTGHLTVTEHPDIFAAVGAGLGVNGVWNSSETVDIFAASGHTPISGTFVTHESPDRFVAIGAGVTRARRRRQTIVA